MYYIYILRSVYFEKYYVGYTSDVNRRLEEHNTQQENSFTLRYRPWEIYLKFEAGDDIAFARSVERKIKKQHSREIYDKLKNFEYRKGFLQSINKTKGPIP